MSLFEQKKVSLAITDHMERRLRSTGFTIPRRAEESYMVTTGNSYHIYQLEHIFFLTENMSSFKLLNFPDSQAARIGQVTQI